jgi:hypothetical protein
VVYRDKNNKIDRIEWFLVKFEKLIDGIKNIEKVVKALENKLPEI